MTVGKVWAGLFVGAVIALGYALTVNPGITASVFGASPPQANHQSDPTADAAMNRPATPPKDPAKSVADPSGETAAGKPERLQTIRANTVSLQGKALTRWQEWREGVERLSREQPAQVYIGGDPSGKRLCLTFDDGPDGRNTPQILDTLRQKGVLATFFVLGEQASTYPQVVKRVEREGHLVASHSYSHPHFTKTGERSIRSELSRTEETLRGITGKRPALFRPPYGDIDKAVLPVLEHSGYRAVLWSLDTFDWDHKRPEEIAAYVIENARSGDIILMHCGGNGAATAKALPVMIDGLRQKGYAFVTVAEMLAVDAYQ
ncbi:polysaccharide deacetylase family protein [Heliobacterium gestii]|uniref:Polysaccharide deacetylase family protein n=1 Tax=Heliomicrobium gestii TaxID=2699 RepID=A0A845L5S8_HELGE|nr:polysaccharide deacetylase family protein [Heliomicrobium gestii]MBM7865724.1 peptidoglycan/xylan/chitin deacetylase (PgdA/CDA1 family) [Heliomicrobium gestii]MZP41972.1 polysaccharide deacetylase family protein [Heliomicrobium gestii]